MAENRFSKTCGLLMLAAVLTAQPAAAAKKAPSSPAAEAPAWQPRAEAYSAFMRGVLLESEGAYEQALPQFLKAAEADPGTPYLQFKAGEMALSLGQMERAEQFLRSGLKMEDSYEARILLARLYQMKQDRENSARAPGPKPLLEAAVREYREAMRLDAARGDAQVELARLYMLQKRITEAEAVLMPFLAAAPRNALAHILLADIRQEQGRDGDAETLLKQAIQADPNSREAVLAMGIFYQAHGRCEDAVPYLENLFQAEPFNLLMRENLGICYVLTRRHEEAVRMLEPVAALRGSYETVYALTAAYLQLDQADKAVEQWLHFLKDTPRHLKARFNLASAYAAAGRYDNALDEYSQLEDLLLRNPHRGGLNEAQQQLLWDVLHHKGMALAARKRYREAGAAFGQAIRLQRPAPEDLYVTAIQSWLAAGDATSALALCVEGLSQHPQSRALRLAMAEIAAADGKDEDAAKHVFDALRQPGAEEDDFLQASGFLFRRKNAAKALEVLEEAQRRWPRSDRVQFQLGALHERQGNAEAAVAHLRKAIELNPLHSDAMNYLGYMWADRGENLEEAKRLIEHAVSMDSKNGAYLDSLGWVNFRMGRHDEARRLLEEAVALHDDPVVRDHLGDAWSALGRMDKAVTEWEKAIQGGVENPDSVRRKVEEAEKRLGGKR